MNIRYKIEILKPQLNDYVYAGLIKFVAGGKDAFLVKYNSMNSKGQYTAPSVDEPCPTVAAQNELMRGKIANYNKHIELNEQALQNMAEKLVKLQAERDELSKQIETWTE